MAIGIHGLLFLLWSNTCFANAVDRDHHSPVYRDEEMLLQVLKAYQQKMTQGSWPVLPAGPTLRPGATDTSIMLLRKRLAATGDLLASEPTASRTFFDDTLAKAVRRFQKRHGLIEDGIVGPATRAALQVSIQDRIHQLSHGKSYIFLSPTIEQYVHISDKLFLLLGPLENPSHEFKAF